MKNQWTTKWKKPAILVFWLFVWQLTALFVQNRILLAGPVEVLAALFHQTAAGEFYLTAACSFLRISAGFFLAFLTALILGGLSWRFPVLEEFLSPLVFAIKSVPVASFVVLFLIWFGSNKLSTAISFLVVFPVIYYSVITGLSQTDRQMLEMAGVFHLSRPQKLWHIYRPALWPSLLSGCRSSLGMAWKSGAAAEVIGTPSHSIGEKLYMAKITLGTADLLAWTLVLVMISFVFEKAVLWLLTLLGNEHLGLKGPFASFLLRLSQIFSSSEKPETDTLIVNQMGKSFGDNRIIDGLSFRLEPGARLGLFAPSGAGKTTLLRLIMGLEQPDSGSIGLQRTKGKCLPLCSAVFQENRLFLNLSAVENVRLVCHPSFPEETIRKELLRLLPSDALTLPACELSGGMQRRTALVRAMLAQSNLVILDEPFTGLDEENRELAICYIEEKLDGRSLILTTHQKDDFIRLNINNILPRTESSLKNASQTFWA